MLRTFSKTAPCAKTITGGRIFRKDSLEFFGPSKLLSPSKREFEKKNSFSATSIFSASFFPASPSVLLLLSETKNRPRSIRHWGFLSSNLRSLRAKNAGASFNKRTASSTKRPSPNESGIASSSSTATPASERKIDKEQRDFEKMIEEGLPPSLPPPSYYFFVIRKITLISSSLSPFLSLSFSTYLSLPRFRNK